MSQTEQQKCCRYCATGKACGDSCINKNDTCKKPRGCACDGSPPSKDKIGQNSECKGKKPSDFVPFTKSRSDEIGLVLGVGSDPTDGNFQRDMGIKFEEAVLKSLGVPRINYIVRDPKSSSRAFPDILATLRYIVLKKDTKTPRLIVYNVREGLIYEIKNTSGSISFTKYKDQTQVYLAHLKKIRETSQDIPESERIKFVPSLSYITPSDARIGTSMQIEATTAGIALYHSVVVESCSKPYGSIKVVNSTLTNYDGIVLRVSPDRYFLSPASSSNTVPLR